MPLANFMGIITACHNPKPFKPKSLAASPTHHEALVEVLEEPVEQLLFHLVATPVLLPSFIELDHQGLYLWTFSRNVESIV